MPQACLKVRQGRFVDVRDRIGVALGMSNFNFNDSSNLEYLDQQYELWEKDYRLVDPSLNGLFTGLAYNGHNGKQFRSNGNGHGELQLASSSHSINSRLQTAAVRLMNAYRDLGHLLAKTDPLAAQGEEPPRPFLLELERFNLKQEDLDQVVDASMLYGINESLPIRDIISFLEETYCGSTGIEYMHIQEYHRRRWLAQRIEPTRNKTQFTGGKVPHLDDVKTRSDVRGLSPNEICWS